MGIMMKFNTNRMIFFLQKNIVGYKTRLHQKKILKIVIIMLHYHFDTFFASRLSEAKYTVKMVEIIEYYVIFKNFFWVQFIIRCNYQIFKLKISIASSLHQNHHLPFNLCLTILILSISTNGMYKN